MPVGWVGIELENDQRETPDDIHNAAFSILFQTDIVGFW